MFTHLFSLIIIHPHLAISYGSLQFHWKFPPHLMFIEWMHLRNLTRNDGEFNESIFSILFRLQYFSSKRSKTNEKKINKKNVSERTEEVLQDGNSIVWWKLNSSCIWFNWLNLFLSKWSGDHTVSSFIEMVLSFQFIPSSHAY